MTSNPLDEKGIPVEDQLRNCSELNVEPVRYPAFRSAGPAPERAADHRVTAPQCRAGDVAWPSARDERDHDVGA